MTLPARQKKILIITGLVFVFIVLPLILFAVFRKPSATSDVGVTSVRTDPISGDEIISGGTTPEKTNKSSQAVLYGIDNIAPLYGDDAAFTALRSDILDKAFPDASLMKVAQKNIVKQVHTEQEVADPYITVSFSLYLDDATEEKDSYRVDTKYLPDDGVLTATITDPSGKTTNYSTNAYGHD